MFLAVFLFLFFFFSSRRRHTRLTCDWSSDVCSSDLYVTLGTDGFGRSDSRAALRRHFEVDRNYIAVAALKALADEARVDRATVIRAIEALGVDPAKPVPWKA